MGGDGRDITEAYCDRGELNCRGFEGDPNNMVDCVLAPL